MEELMKPTDLTVYPTSVVKALNDKLQDWNRHQGKSRAGSTPYASKRKKKRKK